MWDQILGVNLRGVFLCFKHAGKQMLEQGRGGRLIGGGSLGGFSGLPMGSAYAASKAGMRALTHSAGLCCSVIFFFKAHSYFD